MDADAALNTSEGRMDFSGVKKMSSLGVKEKDNKLSTRPPPPTKRKGCSDEKSKDRSKDKGATKESSEKDRGRDKTRKRRSASSGSSSTRWGWQVRALLPRPWPSSFPKSLQSVLSFY